MPEHELGEHLALLQRYLSDEVAPLVFSEALDSLLAQPPELIAAEVHSWVAAQYRGATPLPVSDYLFHVVRKLHVLGELGLMPPDRLRDYLLALQRHLLDQCPEEDRNALAEDFGHLDDSKTVLAAPVQIVHRAGGPESVRATPVRGDVARGAPVRAESPARQPQTAGGTALPARVVQGLRRLNLLLDRLESEPGAAADGGARVAPDQEALLSRILAAAAVNAAEPVELETSLDRLRRLGVNTGTRSVLRLLSQALPDWKPPAAAEKPDAPQHEAVMAMRQVVSLGKDRAETSRRFTDLVHAACEEFNSGSLGRAVTMLDLADRMASGENVDPAAVRGARSSAWSFLDPERLRTFAESAERHQLLRSVLQFFSDLAPEYLLDQLSGEQRRDRRRLLLSLLTVHGAPARAVALQRLQSTSTGSSWADWYVERNLLHLLRRIAPAAGVPVDPEIDVLVRLSQPGAPVTVIKEAIAVLAQHRHPRAEQTLIARVSELEDGLLGVKALPYEAGELLGILDRTVTILARSPSPAARRCVVDHGLRRSAQLGDTVARLSELGNQDLAGEGELVARLVKALRDELPARVFGVTVSTRKKTSAVSQLIAAVSGTKAQAVREVLREVVARYPEQGLAAEAQRALDRLGSEVPTEKATPAASLTGDLGVFGLPTLLQNLADSQVTGTLSLLGADAAPVATLRLATGNLGDVQSGRLQGPTALFALLERHQASRFVFVNAPPAAGEPGPGSPVLPLLMEGMRRLDEFQQATVLVPDDAHLRPTEVKPSRKADETDVELMRAVWLRAVGGATPATIESDAPVDPYRVRRLFEHWVEEGSLVVA
jgi:hypothetical protein